MSDLLALGASGLRTYQTAISTTSENIANANTPGYTRRAAVVTEIPPTWGVKAGGNGSFVSGITRSSDQFRVADVRVAAGDLAKSDTSVVWMDRIEGALSNNQISDRMTAFFNAAKAVAADPAATAPRAVMLESAQSIAVAFAGTGNALTSAANDLAASGADAARDLTDLAGSLDRINRQVAQSTEGTSVRASLLDQRDQVLEQMSGLVDIDVQVDSLNRATVRVGGVVGPVLVDPAGTSAVTFAVNDNGASTFSVHRGGAAATVTPHAGSFAGIADGAQRIAAARETLNNLATSFVDGINAAQAAGRTLDNTAGTDMFAAGNPASQVTVTLTDPRGIAAASVGEGPRGNGNMAALEALRTSAGYESGLEKLTTTNAAALAARKDVVSAQTAIRDSAVAARDAVGGVNLDEEAVDLIRFQQAYQASTRVIQVARETLQAIFDIT